MKSKLLKVIALLCVMSLSLGLLVGCGGNSTSTADKSDATENAADTTAAIEQKTTESEPAKDVTLKIALYSEWEKTVAVDMQKFADEKFSKDFPNIKIEFQYTPFSEFDKKIVASHASGINYDVIITNHPTVAIFAGSGVIESLDSYIGKSKIKLESYNQDFLKTAYYKDALYAIPFDIGFRVLAVNTKLIEEAGAKIPETMQDMVEVAKAVSKNNTGDVSKDKYGMIFDPNQWYSSYEIGQWFVADGGRLFEQTADGKYKATVNTAEAKDWLNWAVELSKYGPKDWISYDTVKRRNAFAQGRVAMFEFGPWEYGDGTIDKSGVQYKLITCPTGLKGSGATLGGFTIAMDSQSKNKAETWSFLETMSLPENIGAICHSDDMPVMKDAFNYPPFNDAKYKVFAEQMESATMIAPAIAQSTEVADIWNKYFQKAVLNNLSVDDALAGAQKDIQAILDNVK